MKTLTILLFVLTSCTSIEKDRITPYLEHQQVREVHDYMISGIIRECSKLEQKNGCTFDTYRFGYYELKNGNLKKLKIKNKDVYTTWVSKAFARPSDRVAFMERIKKEFNVVTITPYRATPRTCNNQFKTRTSCVRVKKQYYMIAGNGISTIDLMFKENLHPHRWGFGYYGFKISFSSFNLLGKPYRLGKKKWSQDWMSGNGDLKPFPEESFQFTQILKNYHRVLKSKDSRASLDAKKARKAAREKDAYDRKYKLGRYKKKNNSVNQDIMNAYSNMAKSQQRHIRTMQRISRAKIRSGYKGSSTSGNSSSSSSSSIKLRSTKGYKKCELSEYVENQKITVDYNCNDLSTKPRSEKALRKKVAFFRKSAEDRKKQAQQRQQEQRAYQEKRNRECQDAIAKSGSACNTACSGLPQARNCKATQL